MGKNDGTDNISGSANWDLGDNPERTDQKEVVQVNRKKVKKPDFKKLDSLIKEVGKYYDKFKDKELYDTLIHLTTAQRTYDSYLDDIKKYEK